MSKLDDELAKDENLWRMWKEEGVTETTPLAVDAFFYATRKDFAEGIADGLRGWSPGTWRSKRVRWGRAFGCGL